MDIEYTIEPNEDWQAAGWTEEAFDWINFDIYDDWLDYIGEVLNDFFDYLDEEGYLG